MTNRHGRPHRGRAGAALTTAALAAAALTTGLSALIAPAVAADPPAAASAGADFAACLQSQQAGDVLLLLDQSQSLRDSDPDPAATGKPGLPARVAGSNLLLSRLADLSSVANAKLNIAISGFDSSYQKVADWQPLTASSLPELTRQVTTFRGRGSGPDTDYNVALEQARGDLAGRAAGDAGAACQAIVMFTDGAFSLLNRNTAPLRKQYPPTPLPYAPGVLPTSQPNVDQAQRAGQDDLCRPGGPADALRTNHVKLLAFGLQGTAQPGDFSLLQALATGASPGDPSSCGSITSPLPGDFRLASNVDDLLFIMGAVISDQKIVKQGLCPVGQIAACPERAFVLDRSVSTVRMVAGTVQDEGTGPAGSPAGTAPPVDVEVHAPGVAQPAVLRYAATSLTGTLTLGTTKLDYQWLSPRTAQVTLTRPDDPSSWTGKWAVIFRNQLPTDPTKTVYTGRTQLDLAGDLLPRWAGHPTGTTTAAPLQLGGATSTQTFGAGRAGQDALLDPAELLGAAQLQAQLIGPDGAALADPTTLDKSAFGKPSALTLPGNLLGAATLRLTLLVTTAAVPASAQSPQTPGTALQPQVVDVPVTLTAPPGVVGQAGPVRFDRLLTGTGPFTGTLTLTGPGCFWLSDSGTTVTPRGVSPSRITASGTTGTSAQTCQRVTGRARTTLPVQLRLDHQGKGQLAGQVAVRVSALDDPSRVLSSSVTFTTSLQRTANGLARAIALAAALLLAIAVPAALLYLVNWRAARLPADDDLSRGGLRQIGPLEVSLGSDGVLRRGDPAGPALVLAETDRLTVQRAPGQRRLLQMRTPDHAHSLELRSRAGRNPFTAPYLQAQASCLVGTGRAVRDGGRTARLPLSLHHAWLLLHDPAGQRNYLLILCYPDMALDGLLLDPASSAPDLLEDLQRAAADPDASASHRRTDSAESSPADTTGATAGTDWGDLTAGSNDGFADVTGHDRTRSSSWESDSSWPTDDSWSAPTPTPSGTYPGRRGSAPADPTSASQPPVTPPPSDVGFSDV